MIREMCSKTNYLEHEGYKKKTEENWTPKNFKNSLTKSMHKRKFVKFFGIACSSNMSPDSGLIVEEHAIPKNFTNLSYPRRQFRSTR